MYKNKKIYFQVMRIIACGLVILNHVLAFALYQITTGKEQFFYMSLTMIICINVPIFFMISGALLLRKDESIITVIKKRVFRIIFLIIVFDFIIMTVVNIKAIVNNEAVKYSLHSYIVGPLQGDTLEAFPYWYLYSYLGVLMMLPFLQMVAKKITKTDVIVILSLHFICMSIVPIINLILLKCGINEITISPDFQVPFALAKPFFYPLMGYYLDNNIDVFKLKKRHVYCMWGIILSCVLVANFCTYIDATLNRGAFTENYIRLFDYAIAIVAFILIKYYCLNGFKNIDDKFKEGIDMFGSLTLGIYMFDPLFKLVIYDYYKAWGEAILPQIIVSFGWVIISMILGAVITYLLRKVPVFRKIL